MTETPNWPLIVNQDGSTHWTGRKTQVGATVNVTKDTYPGCPGGAADICSAGAFDGLVARSMALQLQKLYFKPGVLPATAPAAWKAFAVAGGSALISLKPPLVPSAASDAQFTACVQGIHIAFGSWARAWKGVLWQEPNQADSGFTAAAYHGYCAHYAPLFRSAAPDVPLVYDPLVGGPGDAGSQQSALDFMPGADTFQEAGADFYCTAFVRGGRLDTFAARCDELGKPFGAPEIGVAASAAPITPTQYDDYMAYLTQLFSSRIWAGRDNSWIIWWAGNVGGANRDWITTPDDWKIPMLRRFYDAVSA